MTSDAENPGDREDRSQSVDAKNIASILAEIAGVSDALADAKTQLQGRFDFYTILNGGHEACFGDYKYWLLFAHLKAVEKVLNLIRQDIQDEGSMSLLAATRHVFELNVWLWMMVDDPRNSLIFYRKLLEDQIHHANSYRTKSLQEIELFRDFDKQDSESVAIAISGIPQGDRTDDEIRAAGARMRDLADDIDRKARRKFCLFARQAVHNSYGYQAELIKTKSIPINEATIAELTTRLDALDASLPGDLRKQAMARWNWKESATKAGMEEQYAFLYSLTSKLLHATPFSVVTPTALKPQERVVLLDYIYISILDLLDILKGVEVLANVAVVVMD